MSDHESPSTPQFQPDRSPTGSLADRSHVEVEREAEADDPRSSGREVQPEDAGEVRDARVEVERLERGHHRADDTA